MNQNRYKASFPTPNSTSEFFDSSTWVLYGFWGMLVVCFFAHGIFYYHPDTGFAHEDDLKITVVNVIGLAVLFILKLFAQNIYIIGRVMAALCLIVFLIIIGLTIYITLVDHFPVAYLGGALYFGFASYLLNKDYIKLK
ncbi:hypothetical protein [Pseudocolwellia agarivorans]|uniref:hypothetical protein n=1 Tax=Pseudocolwellia agarivorans TaxID=1911682 RepID=UPI003F885288